MRTKNHAAAIEMPVEKPLVWEKQTGTGKAIFSYRPGCASCDVTACGTDCSHCTSVGDHSAASNSHGCLPNPNAFTF